MHLRLGDDDRQAAVIPDIYSDHRIPVDAYRPTFVKSLAMVPVRREAPIAAVGAYWARTHRARDAEVVVLQTLADAAALAIDNVTVYRDLERALDREREARAAAEEVNRLKDEFLATLSHELRTPLNAVAGWVQMLAIPGLDPAHTERALASVARNVSALRRLVEDLLDVSRIVVGKLELERTPCGLDTIIQETIESQSADAERKGVRIKADIERGVALHADPLRLRQIMGNLLGNAVKFTPRGGDITVTLRANERRAVVVVADTGPGIPPPCCRTASSASARPMAAPRAGSAASVWDCRSSETSFDCTADRCAPRTTRWGQARRSPWSCRSAKRKTYVAQAGGSFFSSSSSMRGSRLTTDRPCSRATISPFRSITTVYGVPLKP